MSSALFNLFYRPFFFLIISNQPDAPGRWASTWNYNKKNLKLARISQFLPDKTQFSLINFKTCIFPDLEKLTILLDFFLKCSNHITEYLWYSFITTKVEASVPFSVTETTDWALHATIYFSSLLKTFTVFLAIFIIPVNIRLKNRGLWCSYHEHFFF